MTVTSLTRLRIHTARHILYVSIPVFLFERVRKHTSYGHDNKGLRPEYELWRHSPSRGETKYNRSNAPPVPPNQCRSAWCLQLASFRTQTWTIGNGEAIHKGLVSTAIWKWYFDLLVYNLTRRVKWYNSISVPTIFVWIVDFVCRLCL